MLPDMEGFEVARRLGARHARVPIIFLTARDATEDKIRGLTLGGDDYVTKPFSLEELVARIRSILRRTGAAEAESSRLTFEDLELDEDTREVTRGGDQVDLTATEYRLLRYLLLNPRRVLTRAQLLEHVWDYDFGGDARVLETYVSYLRKKLDIHGPPLIHTVRGVGYALRRAAARDGLAAGAADRAAARRWRRSGCCCWAAITYAAQRSLPLRAHRPAGPRGVAILGRGRARRSATAASATAAAGTAGPRGGPGRDAGLPPGTYGRAPRRVRQGARHRHVVLGRDQRGQPRPAGEPARRPPDRPVGRRRRSLPRARPARPLRDDDHRRRRPAQRRSTRRSTGCCSSKGS